ncbi:hypothetical protein OROMI_010629 [Orobanche minor]
MATSGDLSLTTCFYISLHFYLACSSERSLHLLTGVHPLDEKYFDAELIKCKDGSKSFARNRLNDNFCDCADGTDEPGTSACPASRFYCRNIGSTPRYLFSSRVNDRICDCCDGSDEYDGTVVCPNTCIMGGNIVYQRINYDSVASNMDALNSKKTKHGIKMVDATHKPSGTFTFVVSLYFTRNNRVLDSNPNKNILTTLSWYSRIARFGLCPDGSCYCSRLVPAISPAHDEKKKFTMNKFLVWKWSLHYELSGVSIGTVWVEA